MKFILVLGGHPEKFCDGRHREGIREIRNELHLAPVAECVEKFIGKGFKPGPKGSHPSRGKGLAHQPAKPTMLRALEHEQASFQEIAKLRLIAVEKSNGLHEHQIASVGAGRGSGQGFEAIVVTRHEPGAKYSAVKDRRLLAKPVPGHIRVGPVFGKERG